MNRLGKFEMNKDFIFDMYLLKDYITEILSISKQNNDYTNNIYEVLCESEYFRELEHGDIIPMYEILFKIKSNESLEVIIEEKT